MPDDVNPPAPSTPEAPVSPPREPAAERTDFNIGEEFGTAKRNLPPPKVLAIALVLVLVIALIVIFASSRPNGSGSINDVNAVEIPDQNAILVTINVGVHNTGDKPMWIHGMKATLETADSQQRSDDAAAPVDFERYFQAFPALKERAIAPLTVETKIPPGADAQGTIVVSFPVNLNAFNQRKSLTVTIQPYDQRAVEITKK
ncbi:MAG TPA: hypothetical protein VMT53_12490 [Terriglobales bacterium]|nr:hypothetical protein [Terriglobales bacterium]